MTTTRSPASTTSSTSNLTRSNSPGPASAHSAPRVWGCRARSPTPPGRSPSTPGLSLDRAGAGERPDHPHVERYHEDRPQGVVGDEEEVRDRADTGEHDRRYSGPRLAGKETESGEDQQDAKKQVNPAPGRDVEVEGVVARHNEELVVDNRY